jgi:hypothetical protein
MAQDIIKEFLVKVGFIDDRTAVQKFSAGIKQAEKTVIGFAEAITAGATAVALGVAKMASNLEALYFASIRTSSAASALKAFDVAARSFGTGAGQALQSAEALARFFRQNPAGGGYVNALLGRVGESAYNANGQLKEMPDLLLSIGKLFAANKRSGMEFQNYQLANILGIDEKTMLAIMNGDLAKKMAETQAFLKRIGFDHAVEGSHAFMDALRKLGLVLQGLGVQVVDVLERKFGISMGKITEWLILNGPQLADKIAKGIAAILDDFEKLLDWWMQNGDLISKRIGEVWDALSKAYSNVIKPVLSWLLDMFLALDKATGGLSTDALVLLAIFGRLGGFALVSGVWSLVGAFAGLARGLLGLAAGSAILSGIATTLLTITGVLAAGGGLGWLINKLLPDKVNDAIGNAVGGTIFKGVQGIGKFMAGPLDAAVKGLMEQGLSRSQAIGVASNMFQESSMNPNASIVDKKGREHWGLMQWDPARQREYSEWAKKAGYNPDIHQSTAEQQTMFAAHELRYSSDPQIRTAWSLMQAHRADTGIDAQRNAEIFSHYVERPGNDAVEEGKRGRRAFNLSQNTTINIYESNDPHKVAAIVKDEHKKLWASANREFAAPTVR